MSRSHFPTQYSNQILLLCVPIVAHIQWDTQFIIQTQKHIYCVFRFILFSSFSSFMKIRRPKICKYPLCGWFNWQITFIYDFETMKFRPKELFFVRQQWKKKWEWKQNSDSLTYHIARCQYKCEKMLSSSPVRSTIGNWKNKIDTETTTREKQAQAS